MKTEEGDEIVEPGVYELEDDRRLHVWISGDDLWACCVYDHGPFCRLCQRVDGMLNALLVNVLDGHMICRQGPDGEFSFQMTKAGMDAVRAMSTRPEDG